MSSKEFGVGSTIPEVRRKSRASRWHCARRLWSLCSIYWTELISITNDGRKSNGCYCSTIWLWRTCSWRNIGTHPGKNGGCTKTTLNSQIRMSGCMDTSSKAYVAEVMGNIEDPGVPLERNLYGHPTRKTLVGKTVRKIIDGTWLGKSTNCECSFVHRKQNYPYRSMWMTSKCPERSRI